MASEEHVRPSFTSAACRQQRHPSNSKPHYKVEPEIVAELYRRWVMPLNKEVQIQYLLRRLEAP